MADAARMGSDAVPLQTLRSGELRIDTKVDPECLRLTWHGRSAARDPRAVLVPYFEQAIAVARQSGTPVEMHFEGLDYFNSSTIAALIDAIRLGSEQRVPMVMIYKENVRWQRMSFDALKMFTAEHDFRLMGI
jgi:hypothetical protein